MDEAGMLGSNVCFEESLAGKRDREEKCMKTEDTTPFSS